MAAKLIFLLLVLALIVSITVLGVFWYFKRRAELSHERQMLREKKRAKLDEQALSIAEEESSIDAELEELE